MLDKLVNEHIILGVDPGTLYMGYALLHTVGSKVEILDFGVFDVHKMEDQYARLQRYNKKIKVPNIRYYFFKKSYLFFLLRSLHGSQQSCIRTR